MEALLDVYSHVGVPEEVLSDHSLQFISKCMKEVSRLLSIKRLTATPYHPICKDLVEKFNGTFKRMLTLKRMKLWERLDTTIKMVQEESRKSQVRNKRLYNHKAKKQVFHVRSKVLILHPTYNNKLLMQWRGP